MNVVYFNTRTQDLCGQLDREVETRVLLDEMEVCESLASLVRILSKPGSRNAVIVLLAETHDTLSSLLSIRELLLDRQILLILPDGEPETLSKGHSLYPRFLTTCDGDWKTVGAVLEKMIERTCSENVFDKHDAVQSTKPKRTAKLGTERH